MIHNLRDVLGLAVAVVAAVSPVTASTASAAEFHSDEASPQLTGVATSSQDISVSGFTVECAEAEFTGSFEGTTVQTVTVHPEYDSCEFFEEPIDVITTGCDYVIDADEDGSEHADLSIDCVGTGAIVFEAPACTARLGSQIPSLGMNYTNSESGTIEIEATLANIAVAEKEGPLCFLLGDSWSYSGDLSLAGDGGVVFVE